MKLELKHVVPYLPYGLKVFDNGNTIELNILNLQILFDYPLVKTDHVKPLLRPFSDLTKEIEHNGEKFIPLDILNDRYHNRMEKGGRLISKKDVEDINYFKVLFYPHELFDRLCEWHFDVFGLIDAGLAIPKP